MADPDAKSDAGGPIEDKMNDEKLSLPEEPVTPNVKAGDQTTATPKPQPAPAEPVASATDSASSSPEGKTAESATAAPAAAASSPDEKKSNPPTKEEPPPPSAPPSAEDTSTPPKAVRPPLIIVAENDSSTPATGSLPPPASDERAQSSEPTTAATVATAPPTLQNHVSGGSDDDGLDEFIKSPHGQNAIVERSPGGRYVRFMEKLGSGASKDVYRAYDTQEGIEVAWNVVSLAGLPKTDRNRIVNEVRLLERLHHHNIISFHGSWVNRERQEVHFVTEILSSGTLKSFINKVQVIRWKIAKRWAVQILKGLEYLHSQTPPVIHRDLKCENIFINGTSGDLRIGDLGLSTVHHNGRVLSVLGTPEFMAPDMYEESSYDQRVDIYAFGMVMLEIFTKEIPYNECKNPAQIYKKVSSGELPGILSRLRSRHARDFIMLCLGYKDENGEYIRPTAKELLTHEFLVKRADDEDEVLVDPPLIKRTIAENDTVSPINSGWQPPATQKGTQNHVQAPKKETIVEKAPNSTPAKQQDNGDQGSADGDESDRFDEMPDSEVNIRKVKVLMGRGQELKEDEEPLADTSGRSIEGSTHSHASSDRLQDPNNPAMKNGVPNLRASKKINVGPSLQVTQPGHYLVAAAVIENEAALAYPDDILKLVVTLPVEGQTQNVQFDFHLVEDDPVQVGKEMVSELGIPQGAVLEISETISGLACAARMQRDKHKMRAQQNSQGQGGPQSQAMGSSGHMPGGPQDMQAGLTMQQQPLASSSEYSSNQPMHTQQASQSSDPIQRQQSQQQLSQPASASQTNQIPADAQSQPASYNHIQNQSHVQHQHQMQGQLQNQQQMNQGNNMMQESQPQMAHFGYDQGNLPQQQQQQQQQQLQSQPMGQHGTPMPLDSLPGYGYDSGRNPAENHSLASQPAAYTYDPGQAQNQGQQQPSLQTQHLHQNQSGVPDVQQQANSYRYDPQQQQQQQQHQSQMNQQPMGQQAPLRMGQHQNQMAPQQAAMQNQSQQQQQLQPMMQTHPNGQQHGNNSLPQASQMQQQVNQGGTQGQPQSFGHVQQQQQQQQQQQPQPQQQQLYQQSHHHPQQQQQQQPQQQQQMAYPSSPLQPTPQQQNPRSNTETSYEHGVSLPNASSQRIGILVGAGMKRSVSTSSHATGNQQPSVVNAPAPAFVGNEQQQMVPTENNRLPPSRSSSGHGSNAVFKKTGEDSTAVAPQEIPSDASLKNAVRTDALAHDAMSSEDDGDTNDELRKLDEDFQKNLHRAKKVFDNRMDNLQRSQIEREAQHQKTLEKHQKERTEFEKRLQQEEKEQNRRIEQLQREWDRRREVLAKNKRKASEDEGSVSAEVSLSSSPDTGYTMPLSGTNMDHAEQSLNQTMSNDSDR